MTLEQLRIFVAVAEALNMTRAAQALHLTQPSVSAAIAALEGGYRQSPGLKLFDRVGRGIELSEAGRTFLPEARAVLARAAEASAALDDLAGLRRGRLRLAASQTVATYWLPARMARFAERWPGVALSLSVGNTGEAAAAVLSGEADLGFVEGAIKGGAGKDGASEALLQERTVGEDRLGLFAAPDHPLAGVRLERHHLLAATWVLREAGSGTRAHLGQVLGAIGLNLADLGVRLELPSNGAVLEALAAGGLITAVSDLAGTARVAAGGIVRLDWAFPPRRFTMLCHRARRPSRAAQAFVEPIVGRAAPALSPTLPPA